MNPVIGARKYINEFQALKGKIRPTRGTVLKESSAPLARQSDPLIGLVQAPPINQRIKKETTNQMATISQNCILSDFSVDKITP